MEAPGDRAGSAGGSWFCPTDLDLERALDTSARVRRARLISTGAVGLALLIVAPWESWWLLALFAAVAANLLTQDWQARRLRHPERAAAGSVVLSEIALGVAVAATGGGRSQLLPWMVIPVAISAVRFRRQVVLAALGFGILATVAAALTNGLGSVTEDPTPLVVALALEVSIVAVVVALQGAEVEHRAESVLDPLTGLLNRHALAQRFAEIEQQARVSGDWVALIVLDVDGFKAVNDALGHAGGDSVLSAIAGRIRGSLRAFELAYRLGGEEFLVVLPAVDGAGAVAVAERLRAAVAAGRPGGAAVTVSAGVAADRGARVSYEELFERADAALYAAKRGGRNRVELDPASSEGEGARPERREADAALGDAGGHPVQPA